MRADKFYFLTKTLESTDQHFCIVVSPGHSAVPSSMLHKYVFSGWSEGLEVLLIFWRLETSVWTRTVGGGGLLREIRREPQLAGFVGR